MKSSPLYISFLFLLLLFGCKKNKNTIVIEGVLLNPITNQGVSGVLLDFSAQQPVSGTYSTAYNTLMKVSTDAGGKFRFEIKSSNASSYRIKADYTGYYLLEELYNPEKFPVGETSTLSLSFYPKGALRVSVKNINPFDGGDKLVFQIIKGAINKPGFCLSNSQTFIGQSVDTTLQCLSYGQQKMVFQWFVTKNNIVNAFSDSLIVSFNDTAFFQLNY